MSSEALNDWPPPNTPPLEWPIFSDQATRFDWYRACINAYAALWEGHVTCPRILPTGEDKIQELETRLECKLPASLRDYHLEVGTVSLAEKLCSIEDGYTPICPLIEAFPAVEDIAEDAATLDLARELIVFGDYLGNGNMFCFHRHSGEVYYFDHDTPPSLTLFATAPQDYLDALMIKCLAEVHDDETRGEELLVTRFGCALVKKWLY